MYSNTYIWNLEKWYQRIYLQGNNGETDIENRLRDMGKGEERVRCMERVTWKVTLPYVKRESQWEFAIWLTGALHQPRGVRWGGRCEGGSKGRGYKYIYG